MRVAGVDGCRGGWLAGVLEDGRIAEVRVVRRFADVLALDVQVIGVDIPIGIPTSKPRAADLAARALAGSAVFLTYPRWVLEAPTHADAVERARALDWPGISRQSYALRSRIFEVDQHAHSEDRVVEVHPEVSFQQLAGRRLVYSKHTWSGFFERLRMLAEVGIELHEDLGSIPLIDVPDSSIAAWSAARYARGEAEPLPAGHTSRIGAIWR